MTHISTRLPRGRRLLTIGLALLAALLVCSSASAQSLLGKSERGKSISEYRKLIQQDKTTVKTLAYQYEIVLQQGGKSAYSQTMVKELVRLLKLVQYADEGKFEDTKAQNYAAMRVNVEKLTRKWATTYHREAQKTKNGDLFTMTYFIYKFYLETFPKSPKLYTMTFFYAEVLYKHQKWDEAKAAYLRALEIDPDGKYSHATATAITAIERRKAREREADELKQAVDRTGSAIASKSGAKSAAPRSWPSLSKVANKSKKARKDDVAVIVAIEDYAFLGDVPGAMRNANAWENFFRQGLGIQTTHTLVNQDVTREKILRTAKKAASQAGKGGTVWFIYIGHGAPKKDGSDGLLIGMDATGTYDSLQARGLPQKALLSKLQAGKQAHTVAIFDACFSGRGSEGQMLARGTQPVIPTDLKPKIKKSTLVLSAARADQVAGALPGADRPAFSYLLLGALRGWSDDGDKKVTAKEALNFVRQQLRYVKGRQQTPEIHGDADLVLATGADEADPGVTDLMNNLQ